MRVDLKQSCGIKVNASEGVCKEVGTSNHTLLHPVSAFSMAPTCYNTLSLWGSFYLFLLGYKLSLHLELTAAQSIADSCNDGGSGSLT